MGYRIYLHLILAINADSDLIKNNSFARGKYSISELSI